MSFVYDICSEQVFAELKLPASLRNDRPQLIGHKLIYDLSAHAALIPHPYHYTDYPDRSLSFYVSGTHYSANELIRSDDGPDRVEIWFESDTDESTSSNVSRLLEAAVATLYDESTCLLPIVVRRKQTPKPFKPHTARPPSEVIPKLNKFCEAADELETLAPELTEMKIQLTISNVLLPEEIESLERHLSEFGWNELSPKAQNLMKIVFHRTRKQ